MMMMRAVRIHAFGGADQLKVEEVPVPEPGVDDVQIKVHAAGVNFVDTYQVLDTCDTLRIHVHYYEYSKIGSLRNTVQRSGLYPLPLPATLGKEGAGVVTKVGASVGDAIKVGDRVAFAQLQGTYAEYVVGKAAQVVQVPAQLELSDAAAGLLQAMVRGADCLCMLLTNFRPDSVSHAFVEHGTHRGNALARRHTPLRTTRTQFGAAIASSSTRAPVAPVLC